MDNTLFSEATQAFLMRFGVIRTAMDRLHGELHTFYSDFGRTQEVNGFGWTIYCSENGRHLVQLYRLHWPNPDGEGIHFELFIDLEELSKGRLLVGLDLHEGLDQRSDLLKALARVLKPHAEHILRKSGLVLRQDNCFKFLRGEIPLLELTQTRLEKHLQCLPDIADSADEALCLPGKTPIWRTAFGEERREIWTNWFGNEGGQSFERRGGRFASWAMRIDGTKTNARKEHEEDEGNYSVLLHPTTDIANGQDIYICAVVKTMTGGRIRFWADAHRGKTPDGHSLVPFRAFGLEHRVEASDRWQSVLLTARVPAQNDLSYDYTREGAWVVMNIITEDRGFLIDSIEIGQCL